MIKHWILLLFVGISNSVVAQQDPYPKWQNFSNAGIIQDLAKEDHFIWCATSDGGLVKLNKKTGQKVFYNSANSKLPGNHVNTIAIDDKGNKWIGTPNGLARFQSGRWKLFTPANTRLVDTHVTNIAIDTYGNKWLKMEETLVKLNKGQFEIWSFDDDELPVQHPDAIATNGAGYTYIANHHKLAKYQSGKWQIVDSTFRLPSIKFMKFDKTNDLWTGHYGGRYHANEVLSRFDFEADSIRHYYAADFTGKNYGPDDPGLHEPQFFSYVQDIVFGDSGRKWLAFSSGLAVGKEGNWDLYGDSSINPEETMAQPLRSLPADFYASSLLWGNGHIWVGTYELNKLLKANSKQGQQFDLRQYPYWQNDMAYIESGRSGRILLATRNGSSLIEYNGSSFSLVKPEDFSFNRVYDMANDRNGKTWVSTDTGLFRYDGRKWTLYNYPNNFTITNHRITISSTQHIWMVSRMDGAYRFNGKAWQHFDSLNSKLKDFFNTVLKVASNGNIWLITLGKDINEERKFFRSNGKKWTPYDINQPSLAKQEIVELPFKEKGKLIIRFEDSGYYYLEKDGLKPYQFPFDSLEPYNIKYFRTDQKGNYWIATNQGLLKYDGNERQLYTPANSGLPAKRIRKLSIDNYGNKWVFTEWGVARFAGNQ